MVFLLQDKNGGCSQRQKNKQGNIFYLGSCNKGEHQNLKVRVSWQGGFALYVYKKEWRSSKGNDHLWDYFVIRGSLSPPGNVCFSVQLISRGHTVLVSASHSGDKRTGR